MALKTPISLVCSYRLADMFAESAKKHRHIAMIVMVVNTLFNIFVTLLFESDEEDELEEC